MRAAPYHLLTAAAAALLGLAAAAPAHAAEPAPGVHFPDLAVAAGADAKVAAVMVGIDVPGAPRRIDTLTITVDTAGVSGVATVVPAGDLELDDEVSCERAAATITCALTGPFLLDAGAHLLPLAALRVTAAASATAGARGELAFTVRADDGPVARHRSTVTVGEGVDLAAVGTAPLRLAPGATGSADLRVANGGTRPVTGVVLAMLGWDERLLAGEGFANCTYGLLTICRFDDELAPGGTYGLSAPVRLRMPADAAAGSSATAIGSWYTPDDFAELLSALPGDVGEEALGTPGTGPAVHLTPAGDGTARAAQVDTDPENNLLISEVVVAGGGAADIAAAGATVSGAPGDTVRARVGFVNRGPGTLYHLSYDNTDPMTRVTVPPGLTAAEVDDRCVPLSEDGDEVTGAREYLCVALGDSTKARASVLFDFAFTIGEGGAGAPGRVRINEEEFAGGPGLDGNAANDSAAITVAATGAGGGGGGLPVTGANSGLLGAAGAVLLLAGAAGVLAARRRRTRFVA